VINIVPTVQFNEHPFYLLICWEGGGVSPQNYHGVLNIVYVITGFRELDKYKLLTVRVAYNAGTEDVSRHPLFIEDVLLLLLLLL
jgi:hypothetical protein